MERRERGLEEGHWKKRRVHLYAYMRVHILQSVFASPESSSSSSSKQLVYQETFPAGV